MARSVVRKALSLFGLGGTTDDFEQFGSTAASSPNFTKDIETIQSLSAWTNGWRPALVAAKAPIMQDMNAVMFVHSYEMVYVLQEGIAEWDTTTPYFIGSVVKVLNSGYMELYTSLTNANTGNAPPTRTTDANWQFNGAVKTGSGLILPGTPTNDSAPAGAVGEYVSSYVTNVSAGTSGQFFNVTTISLTAGDWDVSGCLSLTQNGATIADSLWSIYLSLYSGNTTTDQQTGDNYINQYWTSTFGNQVSAVCPAWRVSLSTTQNVYLKSGLNYSLGTPKLEGRLSARRVR